VWSCFAFETGHTFAAFSWRTANCGRTQTAECKVAKAVLEAESQSIAMFVLRRDLLL